MPMELCRLKMDARMFKCCFTVVFLIFAVSLIRATPLDDYVNRPDPHYSFDVISEYPYPDHVVYIVNMTSQKWKTEAETATPIWWHYIIMAIPSEIRYLDSAFLMIDNGEMHSSVPNPDNDHRVASAVNYALGMGCVAAHIKMIPNQPLRVQEDEPGRTRREDDLIAWTWRRFLHNTSDPEIILRLPMTKAVVRGMDTMATVAKEKRPETNITQFFLSGGSKRGWTAWTTAAVDSRVFAIAPSVMSLINLSPSLRNHFQCLGGWSFAFQDYYFEDLTRWMDTEEFDALAAIEDIYSYRDRYTMPKLIIGATGDQLFLPDDYNQWWDGMPGPKYLWMVENAHHSISSPNRELMPAVRIAFFHAVKQGFQMPQLSWTRTADLLSGSIELTCDSHPHNITAWLAHTVEGARPQDGRRDFRLQILDPDNIDVIQNPVTWTEHPVQQVGQDCRYRVEFAQPPAGFSGFFIKLHYPGPEGWPIILTTQVNIIPDEHPFPPCFGANCSGTLV